jgi:IS605 OrfB family transposase
LRSLADQGSNRAKRSLERLKRREYNFVRNRIGEIVKQIAGIAKEYHAGIAIEDLRRFKPLGKSSNTKIFRIPFYKFRNILAGRCFDDRIELDVLDAYHTSKWCPRCGAVGEGHSKANYALFRCGCGLEVNSDRKASLAIAIKSQLKRAHSQPFSWRAPVNGLLRRNEVGLDHVAVQHSGQLTENSAL